MSKTVIVKKLNEIPPMVVQLCCVGVRYGGPCSEKAVVEAKPDSPDWLPSYLCEKHFKQVHPSRQGKYQYRALR